MRFLLDMIEYLTTNGSTGDRFLFLMFWLSMAYFIWEGVPAAFKYVVRKFKRL